MTEYNTFCFSESYNDENSFQQKRYRVFNKEVLRDRYSEILEIIRDIMPQQLTFKLIDYWKSVTNEQWRQLLAIPEAKDFKEGFEYISGVKIDLENSDKLELLKKADELIAEAKVLQDKANSL